MPLRVRDEVVRMSWLCDGNSQAYGLLNRLYEEPAIEPIVCYLIAHRLKGERLWQLYHEECGFDYQLFLSRILLGIAKEINTEEKEIGQQPVDTRRNAAHGSHRAARRRRRS